PPPAPQPKTPAAPTTTTNAAQAAAKAPASAPDQSDTRVAIRANVNLVVLPVTVKDSVGTLVPDLTKEEFRVFDDSVEQRISIFSVEAFPLSAVILIDDDLKGKNSDLVEESLKAIVGGLSTADEAYVCRFDTNFHPGKGFTKDQDK